MATPQVQVTFAWPHPLGDLIRSAEAMGLTVPQFIATTMEISVTAIPDWEELVDDPKQYDSSIADEAAGVLNEKTD